MSRPLILGVLVPGVAGTGALAVLDTGQPR